MNSATATDKSASADNQASLAGNSFSARLQAAAAKKGWKQRELAAAARLDPKRVNEWWKGPKEPSSSNLFALADALDVSAEWLGLGRGPHRARLVAVDDADWVEVSEYDLRKIDARGKGEAVSTTIFRRDWLYRSLGESAGLWIARTLGPIRQSGVQAGAPIFCKDHPRGELPLQGQHYIFGVHGGGIVIAPFTFHGIGGVQQAGAIHPEPLVTMTNIGDELGSYFFIARIVGVLARPL